MALINARMAICTQSNPRTVFCKPDDEVVGVGVVVVVANMIDTWWVLKWSVYQT